MQIFPCGCVHVCSSACTCVCEHQHLQCFPTDLEGIEFTICGAAFTFLGRHKQAVHLLPHGLFLLGQCCEFSCCQHSKVLL